MYYVYILRCRDNSLYTGITTDFKKRYTQHFDMAKECAKYTKSHPVISAEALWQTETKSSALKLEIRIKQLSKLQKEKLITHPREFKQMFEDKLNVDEYENILIEEALV